jgi:arylsulfatase A-like enzyme
MKPAAKNLIVDELGFSDLGTSESEIATPNRDRLAAGTRFSTFHTAFACLATYFRLFSGTYNRIAGWGDGAYRRELKATAFEDKPSYFV